MTGGRFSAPGTPDLWWIDRMLVQPGNDATVDLALVETIGSQARRERFLHGRRAVRRILSSYLDVAPDALPIHLTADGKPGLPDHFGLAFSISHCGQWTALAVATNETIGVDVVDHADFALAGADALPLVASPRELADLAASGGDPARARLLWARKEALGKALGGGLLADLRTIEIGHADAARARAVQTPGGPLLIIDCPAPMNVTAALCASPPLHGLRIRDAANL